MSELKYEYGSMLNGVYLQITTERAGTKYVNKDGSESYRSGLVLRPEIYGETLVRRQISEWEKMTPEQIEEALDVRVVNYVPYEVGDGHP